MPDRLAREILDEAVPETQRGKYRGKGNAEYGCASVDFLDYEVVMVIVVNPREGGISTIRVDWNR